MSSDKFALLVAVAMFAAGLIGLLLQRVLPEHHTTGGSRDMIAAVVGLLTLLCALVTGLLIWTAYGVYSGQNTQIQALASKVMQLDLALSDYGPEANPARAQLRDALGKTIDQVWSANESDSNFAADNFRLGDPDHAGQGKSRCEASTPRLMSKSRRLPLRRRRRTRSAQARMQMAFALTAPISYPLLLIVVGWVVCLFCGFGLTSRGTVTSVIALAVGSIAVASAVLLDSGAFHSLFGAVSSFVRAIGASARRHGQGVTRPGGLTGPCPDSSPRSGQGPL